MYGYANNEGWAMNIFQEYKNKLRTPEEAVQVVRSGDWVDYGGTLSFPILLDAALAARKEELEDVTVRSFLVDYPIQIVEQDPEQKHFIYNSWILSSYERKLFDRGLCYFIPMLFRNLPRYYRNELKVNVCMMQTTPMDDYGYFNFSINNATARAMIDAADVIILEINENLPRINGGEQLVHISEVDYIVEGEHGPLYEMPIAKPTRTDELIARQIVSRMTDGAVLQIGVGNMPNAICKQIANSDLKNLGVHSELMADAFLDLHKQGILTNRSKWGTLFGKSVFGFAKGSKDLYDWVAEDPTMLTFPMDFVNDVRCISKINNFVSINNCISIDLYGQIAAETAGTRQISGTGGQLDFLTGAYDNTNGTSYICLSSTFTDKNGIVHSRIKPTLTGDIVTDPRSQTNIIVTEYGMENLAGSTSWQRAEQLIRLAHPDFREDLIKAAEEQRLWRRSNKR